MGQPPILRHKDYRAPSVFTPDALLREARRQKKLGVGAVPDICILVNAGVKMHRRPA
jgi:hypothetical protein